DRKDAYVKRLVGMPGDSVEYIQGELFVNGKSFIPKKDALVQHRYKVTSRNVFSPQLLYEEYGLLQDVDYSFWPNGYMGVSSKEGDEYNYLFNALTDEM